MPAMYSIARSTYTKEVLWAIIADDEGGYAVVRPGGSRNEDQERRIGRLFELARKKPTTPDGIIRLASMNQSAVSISLPVPAADAADAKEQALAALG